MISDKEIACICELYLSSNYSTNIAKYCENWGKVILKSNYSSFIA